ncbi:MAG TPA: SH3 domain-containing protein [Terriglobales bacterium]|nr:SH3 domain-containing protein [Terriglobales bacterium]
MLAMFPACKRQGLTHHEFMYVSAAETSLRDRVATMYNKLGTVHNGDRVEVLERQRRFVRVRTDNGQEGWIEERSLVPQDVYDGFQKLAQDDANTPVQARGTTRAELNMHVEPSRDAEHLYQLKDGEKVDILRRATAEKNPPKAPKPAQPAPPPKTKAGGRPNATKAGVPGKTSQSASQPATPPAAGPTQNSVGQSPPSTAATTTPDASAAKEQAPPPKPVMEDWYLVRNSSGHVGWVLLRMVDLDVPLDVAQYAEGQRIIGYFVLNNVEEDGKPVPQYLVLLNEPKDGLAYDYNQIRVFTRNRAKHRYETAYRQRNLNGYLPVKVGHQDFGKEGDLPTFTIREKNDAGQIVEETYKLNGPIVRRVLTPEEEALDKEKHQAALAARMKELGAHHGTTTHKHKKH